MPKKGVRFEYWYGYPREKYRLGKKHFAAKYPPHDAFGGWCVKRLREGIAGSINQLPQEYRKIAHFDGSGDYVADQSYRLTIDGKKSYCWVELHTGSEGYGWEKFLKRIITAEERLRERGKFLVIVPFKREKEKAKRAIKKYNEAEEREGPRIEQKVSQVIAYEEIADWQEQEGLYEHQKRV
ncbi:MAG: hypothetical protein GF308_05895 [Candidatus Heimdallarchaeota archaeon]|nr:hypothetical protein [Candidatus Heimdallarchaeota archaeon]